MKIGDIEVGVEYGAHDNPTRTYRQDPRRVKALAVKVIEETYWRTGGFRSERATRNVRRVEVRVLDEPTGPGRYSEQISKAAKGDVIVIEARQILGKWSDLSPAIAKRIADAQSRAEAEAALTQRIQAIVGIEPEWGVWQVEVKEGYKREGYAEFSGSTLDDLLTLAERGAEHAPEKGASA